MNLQKIDINNKFEKQPYFYHTRIENRLKFLSKMNKFYEYLEKIKEKGKDAKEELSFALETIQRRIKKTPLIAKRLQKDLDMALKEAENKKEASFKKKKEEETEGEEEKN